MTDNTYSGTLKFKDVDFVFVFDGSELVLIPPKERKNDIMWGWLKKEICPGVYTSGDALTVDVPYLDGFCNETSKRLIFLTREESTVGSRNSTLYINVAGYLECSPNTNGFCRMTLSGRALVNDLDHIPHEHHPLAVLRVAHGVWVWLRQGACARRRSIFKP